MQCSASCGAVAMHAQKGKCVHNTPSGCGKRGRQSLDILEAIHIKQVLRSCLTWMAQQLYSAGRARAMASQGHTLQRSCSVGQPAVVYSRAIQVSKVLRDQGPLKQTIVTWATGTRLLVRQASEGHALLLGACMCKLASMRGPFRVESLLYPLHSSLHAPAAPCCASSTPQAK